MKTFKFSFFIQAILILSLSSSLLFSDSSGNDSCNSAETITELDKITDSTSHTESGSLYYKNNYNYDYYDVYKFKPGINGTLNYNYSSNKNTHFFISNSSCGSGQVLSDGTSASGSIEVSSNQTIYLYNRVRQNGTTTYNISFTFTAKLSINIIDQFTKPDQEYSLEMSDYTNVPNGSMITNYSLTGDALPTGVTFNSNSGRLSGTPTSKAILNFTITVTDNNGQTATDDFILAIDDKIQSSGGRDFSLRTQYSLFGDVKVIGNTVLCEQNSNNTCKEVSTSTSNADVNLQKVSQTYSTLELPSNAIIEYARLYWQGRLDATSNDTTWDSSSKAAAGQIEIRKGTVGSFTTINADIQDFNQVSSTNFVRVYSSSADVTNFVKSGGTGIYSIDPTTFYTSVGETNDKSPSDGLGSYGAWVLVVVYTDPDTTTAKNISIFDGYKVVQGGESEDISVRGFITPRSGDVDSKVYAFTGEGDAALSGDSLYMGGKNYNQVEEDSFHELGHFDSKISATETRSPNLNNNNGIDIQVFDVGTTPGAKNIITTNESGADFILTTDDDIYFPSLLVFSTEIYLPKLCYDYSYKQSSNDFTEDNDGTQFPKITNSGKQALNTDDPIEVGLYIRNLIESDISVTDMYMNITDINTTQASYIPNSTTRAKTHDLEPLALNDSSFNVGSTSLSNIPIGDMGANDYVYIDYNLNPHKNEVDMPLHVTLDYILTINGKQYEYTSRMGSTMPICSSANASYIPEKGVYNIVHNQFYTNDPDNGINGTQYYNIPTQIASRPGDFKVTSFDENDFDLLKDINTTVAVELISVRGYHDVKAACDKSESSISPLIWITLQGTSAPFRAADIIYNHLLDDPNIANTFYKNATKETAFRISYPVADENGTAIYNEVSNGKYRLKNFPSYAGTECKQPVLFQYKNNGGSTVTKTFNQVSQACANAGQSDASAMTQRELNACLQCIYGHQINYVCSRDNFAIRPEAFSIKLNDQNQENSNLKKRIANNASGNTSPDTTQIDLAAGYDYYIEVNATNYLNSDSTPGYTKTFSPMLVDDINYTWNNKYNEPYFSACNDLEDKPLHEDIRDVRFIDGAVDMNTSVNQVGEYQLSILDTDWTIVDHDPSYMQHHNLDSNHFISSNTADCLLNNSSTQVVEVHDPYLKNGCNTSSNHDASYGAPSNIKYRDYNVEFHPYWFDMRSIIPSHGLDNNITFDVNTSIYTADMFFSNYRDQNMSMHINGKISALGENNSTLSNFVDQCYAKDVEFTLNISGVTGANDYGYVFTNMSNYPLHSPFSNIAIYSGSVSDPIPVSTDILNPLDADNFDKNMTGSIDTAFNLNFSRSISTPTNPEEITFNTYKLDCQTEADCTMLADTDGVTENSITTKGSYDLNQTSNIYYDANTSIKNFNNPLVARFIPIESRITLKHYYGRSHASRQRYIDNNGTANIYYEAYCFGTTSSGLNANRCNKNLLQDGNTSTRTDDLRWYINTQHTRNEGNAGTVTEKGLVAPRVVSTGVTSGNHPDNSTLMIYDETAGYPYKTTMENNASRWLIYNPDDVGETTTTNSFQVEFDRAGSNWTGVTETDKATNSSQTVKTNRRSQW